MKMNRTNTAGRILLLLLTALLVLSLAACGKKGNDDMTKPNAEPKNAQEAAAMYKALMDQENAILMENQSLWEKVFMSADKGMTMQEVVDLLHDEHGWSDSVSNLSNKLQRESLRYVEAVQLADALGYEIVWQRRK